MAIDGLVILDNTGRPIIQSGFRSSPPAYPILHIDALNEALSKADRSVDVDPVLYLHNPGEGPSACCHVKRGELRFLGLLSGDTDPLYVFAFLETFIDILKDYFGHLSAETLKENFDVVYQLLEETLDAGGHPSTTSINALKDIVLPPSLLSKVLSVAGVSGLTTLGTSSHPFASPIPWRKAGVRYNTNEIFFDMAEELKGVVNKNGTVAVSSVWGKVHSNCRLSGTPDLLLSFSNAQPLTNCSFHPCVRLQRWTRDKHLSFVPPDGKFILMEYNYTPGGVHHVAVPFALKPLIKCEENGGTIDVTMTSRLTTKALENVRVELYLGEGTTTATCIATNNASWNFDPRTRILHWDIKAVSASSTYSLKGPFSSTIKYVRPSRAFRVQFEIPQHTFSSLKVDQLKMTGEMYKPYKGVRGRSTGDVEWRW
ncbi:hypothetical protein QCA50_001229 [Cerrena zonata]|uniref:MHD domain-containing protein n=1 Tax=Cerrena zonata TaxID=2478898 RepID=A0AAW0H0V2_9APHY